MHIYKWSPVPLCLCCVDNSERLLDVLVSFTKRNEKKSVTTIQCVDTYCRLVLAHANCKFYGYAECCQLKFGLLVVQMVQLLRGLTMPVVVGVFILLLPLLLLLLVLAKQHGQSRSL